MTIQPFRLVKLVAAVLVAGVAVLSGVPFEAAADDVLLCSNTGRPCRSDLDCTRVNVTCFCANINPTTGIGVCRGDLELTKN